MESSSSASPGSNAPTDAVQQALAGAFITIKSATKALALQPQLPAVTIKGLDTVNDSLAVAQTNTRVWTDTLSQTVQNQLQRVVDYNALYAELHETIMAAINTVSRADHNNPPTDVLAELQEYLVALQGQVQGILYGASGDKSKPDEASALGAYNAITAYSHSVARDAAQFTGYKNLANSSESGISADLKQLQLDIDADEHALNNDRTMIAGGAAMVVTGVLICVVAVALAPETGGATIAAIGVVGVGAIVGGAAMATVAGIDLAKKQQDVVKKTAQIAADKQELAALSTIGAAANNVATQAATIHGALDTLVSNWQQMENDMGDVITNLAAPEHDLMAWIEHTTGQQGSYGALAAILKAQFGTADRDWAAAGSTAQTILTNLKSVVEFELPPASQHDLSSETLLNKAFALHYAV